MTDPVALLRRYIRLDTSNPPGDCREAADLLCGVLRENGLSPETFGAKPEKPNVFCHVGGTEEPGLVLVHHMDVVPARAEEWSVPPFSAEIRDGFMFGIKIFAPVVVIGGFFFLGSGEIMPNIVGETPYTVSQAGILGDVGYALAAIVPLTRIPVAVLQFIIGVITGLDGSGFSGLPLVGSLAQTFSTAAQVNKATLASLGQITTIWVGGGTLVPWGLIPVAAICGVEPFELARRNFWPVMMGLVAMLVVAIIIM